MIHIFSRCFSDFSGEFSKWYIAITRRPTCSRAAWRSSTLFARVNSSHVKPVYHLYGFRVDQSRTCCGNVLDTSHMAYGVCQDEDSQPSEWSVSRKRPCRRLNALAERKVTLLRVSSLSRSVSDRMPALTKGNGHMPWKRSPLVISVG